MSLTVIRPRSSGSSLTTSTFSMRCLCSSPALRRQGAFLHRDQAVALGHDVADRIVSFGLEAHVAVGDDADQLAAVDHRHAGDVARAGQRQHLADGGVGADGDRVRRMTPASNFLTWATFGGLRSARPCLCRIGMPPGWAMAAGGLRTPCPSPPETIGRRIRRSGQAGFEGRRPWDGGMRGDRGNVVVRECFSTGCGASAVQERWGSASLGEAVRPEESGAVEDRGGVSRDASVRDRLPGLRPRQPSSPRTKRVKQPRPPARPPPACSASAWPRSSDPTARDRRDQLARCAAASNWTSPTRRPSRAG